MQPLQDFSGGLWLPGDANSADPQPGFAVPANALLEADNVEYVPNGGVRGRRGRQRRSSFIYDSQQFVGLHRHYPRGGAVPSGPVNSYSSVNFVQAAGAVAWVDPATFSSVVPITCTLTAGQVSQLLRLTAFGFAIPADATIAGIQVIVARSATGTVTDGSVRLFIAGSTLTTEDRARSDQWAATSETVIYGGLGDTWGRTWTPAEINASGSFGPGIVAAAADGAVATITAVQVTVYYVAPTHEPQLLVAMNVDVFGTPLLQHVYLKDDGTYQTFPGFRPYRPAERIRHVSWPAHDAVFVFDGVNPLRRYNSPAGAFPYGNMELVTPAIGSLAPAIGPYADLWNSRLWATTPTEINFSVYGCEVNDPTKWFPDIQLSVNDARGGRITGIVGLASVTSPLVILKDTCLFSFLGDPVAGGQLNQFSTVGNTAPETVQQCPWGIIYLGHGGLYLTDAQSATPTELSGAIATLFAPRTADEPAQYPNAVGAYHTRRRQYWLKLDPTAVDGYVLQFIDNAGGGFRLAWSHVPVMPLVVASVWDGSGDKGELVVGSDDGLLREFDTGKTDDDGTADGQPIPVLLRTRSQLLDDKSPLLRSGRAAYVKPQYRGTVPLAGQIRFQDDPASVVPFMVGNTLAAPAFQTPRATITDLAHFGKVIDFQLLNPSDGPDFELRRIAADVQLRTVRKWQ